MNFYAIKWDGNKHGSNNIFKEKIKKLAKII